MTSKSTNYSIDRDTLIRMAYETFNAATEGEDIQPEMVTVAARWLNLQLKNYTTLGFKMWKRERKNIALVSGKSLYTIGQNARGTATATTASKLVDVNADFVADASVGDTVLNTTDSTSTTITAIDSTDIVSLADDIFAVDETYEITVANVSLNRPDRILECNRKDSSGNTTTVNPLSSQEYDNLPNKSQTGTPINYFYDPVITNGALYFWQTPGTQEAIDFTIDIVAATQVHDMDNSTDMFDFPQEWLLPITIFLGYRLETIYGSMSVSERQLRKQEAQDAIDEVADYDQDTTSVFFQPDLRG